MRGPFAGRVEVAAWRKLSEGPAACLEGVVTASAALHASMATRCMAEIGLLDALRDEACWAMRRGLRRAAGRPQGPARRPGLGHRASVPCGRIRVYRRVYLPPRNFIMKAECGCDLSLNLEYIH